jgi:hypothetical protein
VQPRRNDGCERESTRRKGKSGITVQATNIPSWLRFDATAQRIASLRADEEIPVSFTFAVDKSAPVNQSHTLRFEITSPRALPELPQSLQSEHGYQLSADSRVSLKVFDLLGREIATLVEENRPAGFHQTTFNASGLSSGMYVYQLMTTGELGDQRILRKTMLLVK